MLNIVVRIAAALGSSAHCMFRGLLFGTLGKKRTSSNNRQKEAFSAVPTKGTWQLRPDSGTKLIIDAL